MRTIYYALVWILFRGYCWLFRFNGLASTHRIQTLNAGLLAEIWYGYYPYLDKALLGVSWTRHYEAGVGFYYIVVLTWGPAWLVPPSKYNHKLSDLDLATFSDNIISAKLIRL